MFIVESDPTLNKDYLILSYLNSDIFLSWIWIWIMSMCLLNSLRPQVFFMLVCFLFVLYNKSWFSFRYIHCLCTLEVNAPNTINLEAFMLTITLSNGNIFRVTILLWGESTGHRWIPHHKTQWRGALMISLICAWTNNPDAGDLRRHRAHYDVNVM